MKHRMQWLGFLVAVGVAIMGAAPAALADSLSGCGDCFGTVYTLQYITTPDSSTATTQTFDIILTLDTSATSGAGPNLAAVAAKVASASNFVTGALETAPAAGWTEMDGGLGSSGCTGVIDGFVCAENLTTPLTVPDGTYVWVFDVTVLTGTLLTGAGQASVKALYEDASFKHNGITSDDITLQVAPIPEPATLLLFGSGLIGLGAKLRRRRRA